MDSLNHKTLKQGVYFEGGISPQISQFVASVNFEYDHHICYFKLTGKLQLNCKSISFIHLLKKQVEIQFSLMIVVPIFHHHRIVRLKLHMTCLRFSIISDLIKKVLQFLSHGFYSGSGYCFYCLDDFYVFFGLKSTVQHIYTQMIK